MGRAKIGFTYAFSMLNQGFDYITAISNHIYILLLETTIEQGGDTDTNAAIVGGLIGAAVHEKGIPEEMKKKLLECSTKSGAHPRPSLLVPMEVDLIKMIGEIFDARSAVLSIIKD